MTTYNSKQNPTNEVEPVNEAELGEEMLEEVNGGIGIGPFGELIIRNMPKKPEKPKDGGATGSW